MDEVIVKILHETENLKRLPRAGWKLRGVPNPESVAEHTFRLVFLTLFAPASLDHAKLRDMALVHDLGEIVAGDYTPHDKVPKEVKYDQEKLFFQWVQSILPHHPVGERMLSLWQEHEDGVTPEAKWLSEADGFESVLQSVEYTKRGNKGLEEFMTMVPNFKTREMTAWGRIVQESLDQSKLPARTIPIIFMTGYPRTGKAAYSKRLAQDLDAHYLSLEEQLKAKSADANDPHADFAALYLKKGLDTSPIGYILDLLEEGVQEGRKGRKTCVVIDGFPRTTVQLRRFEEKVQGNNFTLLLTSDSAAKSGEMSDFKLRSFRELEAQYDEESFAKIDVSGPEDEVYAQVKTAAAEYLGRASP